MSDIDVNIGKFAFPNSDQNIFDNFELHISSGEFLSILGHSGVGKTTLLRIMAGLDAPQSGSVTIGGEAITRPRKSIQYLFQDARLLPWYSARDNVTFASDNSFSQKSRSVADQLLEQLGLHHRADAWPKHLSGGEKTRTALARALLANPDVLLLDEPMRGLDVRNRAMFSEVLDQVGNPGSRTLVMVSHDVDEAIMLSDRVVVLGGQPASITLELELSSKRPRERNASAVKDAIETVRGHIIKGQ